MPVLRRFAALLAIVGLVLAAACSRTAPADVDGGNHAAAIGGPFALVDQSGRPVTDRDFRGRPLVIYFGYTYCPEACPTTLAAMSNWIKTLGPDANRLSFAFVSIDPERDTPAVMARYLTMFDPQIHGLTGTPAQVAQIAKAYRVYYRKVPIQGSSYTVDHSTVVYLMRSDGSFEGVIGYQEPPDQAVTQLRELLRS